MSNTMFHSYYLGGEGLWKDIQMACRLPLSEKSVSFPTFEEGLECTTNFWISNRKVHALFHINLTCQIRSADHFSMGGGGHFFLQDCKFHVQKVKRKPWPFCKGKEQCSCLLLPWRYESMLNDRHNSKIRVFQYRIFQTFTIILGGQPPPPQSTTTS